MIINSLINQFSMAYHLFTIRQVDATISHIVTLLFSFNLSISDKVPLNKVSVCLKGTNCRRMMFPEVRPIALLMVHVEKWFRKVQETNCLSLKFPSPSQGSNNQLFTVACLPCNNQNRPVGKKWKREVWGCCLLLHTAHIIQMTTHPETVFFNFVFSLRLS